MAGEADRLQIRPRRVVVSINGRPSRGITHSERRGLEAAGAPRQRRAAHVLARRRPLDRPRSPPAAPRAVLDLRLQLPVVQIHRVERLVHPHRPVGAPRREAQAQVAGRELHTRHGPSGVREGRLVDPPGGRGALRSPSPPGRPGAGVEESVRAPLGGGERLESPLAFLPDDDRVICPGRGQQLAEFRMRPPDPVDGAAVRLPLVGGAPSAPEGAARPQSVRGEVPVGIKASIR